MTTGELRITLYDLDADEQQLKLLLEDLPEDAEEQRAALEEALAIVQIAMERKGDAIVRVYRQGEAEADWYDHQAAVFQAEADRLRQHARTKRAGNERLMDRVRFVLEQRGDGTQKLEGSFGKITLSKRPENDKAVVVDDSALPDAYKRATLKLPLNIVTDELKIFLTAVEVSKTWINESVEEGLIPPGVQMVPGTRTLKVY